MSGMTARGSHESVLWGIRFRDITQLSFVDQEVRHVENPTLPQLSRHSDAVSCRMT
jgi:hypothetical protein